MQGMVINLALVFTFYPVEINRFWIQPSPKKNPDPAIKKKLGPDPGLCNPDLQPCTELEIPSVRIVAAAQDSNWSNTCQTLVTPHTPLTYLLQGQPKTLVGYIEFSITLMFFS